MADAHDDHDQQARDHAWDWFALHAGQRMDSLNFFLVATAFLVAGYADLLEKNPLAAVGVAAIGAWIAVWFSRLDRRTRQLVEAGEKALKVSQARLAEQARIDEVKLLEATTHPTAGASTYHQVIAVVEWTVALGFTLGAVYAACLAAHLR
jgi:hypothetical protein